MNIKKTNTIIIMMAFLIMVTACNKQKSPSITEDESNTEVSSMSSEESDTSDTDKEPSKASEEEPSETLEHELSQAEQEESSQNPKKEISDTVEEESSQTSEEEAPKIPAEEQTKTTEEESAQENVKSDQMVNEKENYDKYFSNSVFVGDSVMEGFAQYIRGQRKNGVSMLSNAQFLTSIMGIKVADIIGETEGHNHRYYTYRGKEQPLEKILSEMGVERAFIMLGMNDLGVGFSAEETINKYRKMIPFIKETNPNLEVIVMTTTPKTAATWLPDYIPNQNFGSPLLNKFADMLKVMCEEEGIEIVDVNAAVRGADGHLPDEYSRDNFVHINNKCSAVVLDTLREFAKIQLGE